MCFCSLNNTETKHIILYNNGTIINNLTRYIDVNVDETNKYYKTGIPWHYWERSQSPQMLFVESGIFLKKLECLIIGRSHRKSARICKNRYLWGRFQES